MEMTIGTNVSQFALPKKHHEQQNVSVTMCPRLPPPLRILNPPPPTLPYMGNPRKIAWVGVCGPRYKTLTLSTTKISDFQYPIYDLTLDRLYHVSVTVYLIRRSWVRFPPRSKDFLFTSCGSLIPSTRANAQWVIHGFY